MRSLAVVFLIFACRLACFGADAARACAPCTNPPRGSTDPRILLDEGNKRFRGISQHPRANNKCLKDLVDQGQTCQPPFAAILSCSDSRFAPEILYDQGVGDLFVIRVAGNVATAESMASIEYAVNKLGVRYVVVLGHEKCGAVEASFPNTPPGPHLDSLWKLIHPVVVQPLSDRNWDLSARRNVNGTVNYLKLNLKLKEPGAVIVGAYAKLSGEVALP